MDDGTLLSAIEFLVVAVPFAALCAVVVVHLRELPRRDSLLALGLVLFALLASLGDRLGLSMPQTGF